MNAREQERLVNLSAFYYVIQIWNRQPETVRLNCQIKPSWPTTIYKQSESARNPMADYLRILQWQFHDHYAPETVRQMRQEFLLSQWATPLTVQKAAQQGKLAEAEWMADQPQWVQAFSMRDLAYRAAVTAIPIKLTLPPGFDQPRPDVSLAHINDDMQAILDDDSDEL